ncbi:MAG: ribose 5-phosphate isomerase B [Cyclobacteriaceae bacterium]
MKKETLVIASDHAGYERKEYVKKYLEEKGYEVKDLGAYSAERSDYPDFGHALATSVEKGEFSRGISLCGSGNGINITANKHQDIRAALCWNEEIAALARLHNDANICSLPARFISNQEAEKIVDAFLNTEFEGGRHERRIKKIPL